MDHCEQNRRSDAPNAKQIEFLIENASLGVKTHIFTGHQLPFKPGYLPYTFAKNLSGSAFTFVTHPPQQTLTIFPL